MFKHSLFATLFLIACFTLPLLATQIKDTGEGYQIGNATTEKIGLHGATPSTQRAGAAQAALGSLDSILLSTRIVTIVATGSNGAGAVTATGLAVGDLVHGAVNITDGTDGIALFESTITVVNQIQQSSATDLSAKKFIVTVERQTLSTAGTVIKTLVNEIRAMLVEKGLMKGAA